MKDRGANDKIAKSQAEYYRSPVIKSRNFLRGCDSAGSDRPSERSRAVTWGRF
jgi:hypothetical protein